MTKRKTSISCILTCSPFVSSGSRLILSRFGNYYAILVWKLLFVKFYQFNFTPKQLRLCIFFFSRILLPVKRMFSLHKLRFMIIRLLRKPQSSSSFYLLIIPVGHFPQIYQHDLWTAQNVCSLLLSRCQLEQRSLSNRQWSLNPAF